MNINFKIFVENEIIYCGKFSEVPQEHREKTIEALNEWGEVLGKRNLNEMIFSLLAWHNQKHYECTQCGRTDNENTVCSGCGKMMHHKNKYPQNEKISAILDCIGMITHLEVEQQ